MEPYKFLVKGMLFLIGYVFMMTMFIMLGYYDHELQIAVGLVSMGAIFAATMHDIKTRGDS